MHHLFSNLVLIEEMSSYSTLDGSDCPSQYAYGPIRVTTEKELDDVISRGPLGEASGYSKKIDMDQQAREFEASRPHATIHDVNEVISRHETKINYIFGVIDKIKARIEVLEKASGIEPICDDEVKEGSDVELSDDEVDVPLKKSPENKDSKDQEDEIKIKKLEPVDSVITEI